ncbi:hypothetical protein CICLE_v10033190mg [Citrus x clementina]|uniref:Uncharacterized protein n=2 Tax=Citrus TaxID=2706 RepID=V4T9E0_CITCL|nr:hypothetical protein CICLE_v10033190mg [Citrus x clementina]GAY55393.1 hypothetical protein CUMW_163930 [Citrus unshiu]
MPPAAAAAKCQSQTTIGRDCHCRKIGFSNVASLGSPPSQLVWFTAFACLQLGRSSIHHHRQSFLSCDSSPSPSPWAAVNTSVACLQEDVH